MLDSLRHFALIAEHGTFTEAAKRAHLSQPALTASIRRLEEQLGARLLERGRGGATLTAEGEALLPRAYAALAAVEDGRRAVAEVAGLHAGEVRIAGGATATTYFLPPEIARFRQRHPGIRFHMRETTTAEAEEALSAGELDLAVLSYPHARPEGTDHWRDDDLILVAAPDVDPDAAPFVTFREGATTRHYFDRHFPGATVVMELWSIAAVKGHVREGVGVALVSRHAVQTDLALGRLVEVPHVETPIRRELSLVHRGADRLPPAAAALRRQLLALEE